MAALGTEEIHLIGRVGRDPETRQTPDGKKVVNFSLAMNRPNVTTWYNIAAWGKTADFVEQYVRQGQLVRVKDGKLSVGSDGYPAIYTKRDGTPGVNLQINTWKVDVMDWNNGGNGGNGGNSYGNGYSADEDPYSAPAPAPADENETPPILL